MQAREDRNTSYISIGKCTLDMRDICLRRNVTESLQVLFNGISTFN